MIGDFHAGMRVTLPGHETPFVVHEAQATDGGTWRLGLRPGRAPFDLVWVDVWQSKPGLWLTEELEEMSILDQEHTPEMPAGYVPCKGCEAPIRWSYTKGGRHTPVNPDGSSHWETCPKAERFKRVAKVRAEEPAEVSQESDQLALF